MITKMHYDKLVRDNIPDIICKKGEECTFHTAHSEEYAKKLFEKLQEEVDELKVSQTDKDMLLTELADVREVCNAIATYYGCTEDELQIIQNKKREEKGGFDKRIILDNA